MIKIGRVSSATMRDLGAYDTKDQRLNRIFEGRQVFLPRANRSKRIDQRSLPTSIERRLPGREHYDGFTMKRRGRGKRMTKRKKHKKRNTKRRKKRNTKR